MGRPDDKGNYSPAGREWLREKGFQVIDPPYTAAQIERAARKDLKPIDKRLKELKKAREKEKRLQCTGDACPLPPPGKKSRLPWKSSDGSMSSSSGGSSGSKGWFSSRRHGSSGTMTSSGASMNTVDSSKKTESTSGSSRGWFSRRRPSKEEDLSKTEPGTSHASMTSIKEGESDSDSSSTTSSEPPESPPPEKLNKTPSTASEAGTSKEGSLKKIESTGGGTFTPKECTDYCNTVEGYIVINPGYSRIPITKGYLADNGKACDCKLKLVDIRDYLVKLDLNDAEFFDAYAASPSLGRKWLTDHKITVDFRKTLDERFKEQNEEEAKAGGTSEITPA
nr:PREDICTED: uncharacterized protein LOC109037923 [Bemisia tabaci]